MNYIILSLKHSEGKQPCFWKPDNAGYTIFPWAAGIYAEDKVRDRPNYYNDGVNTLAIPISTTGLESIGLKIEMDITKVKALATAAKFRKEASHG